METHNILVFIPNDSRAGGSDEVLFQIARYYTQKNANVYVLFLTKIRFGDWQELEKFPNVQFYSNRSLRELYGVIPTLINVFRLRKILFDYVFSSNPHTADFLGQLRMFGILKTKFLIGREHCSVFLRFSGRKLCMYNLHYHLGYRALNCLICQSKEMKAQFIEGVPSIARKINPTVIPNPVNLAEMREKGSKEMDYPYSFQNRTIVSAGRFVKEKGFDLLIEAFYLLQKDETFHDVRLLILGDGPDRAILESSIKQKGLHEVVFLPGMSKNIYPYFKRATLCVISSRIEGFPNVLLQMMSQCDNIVSTSCAGDIDQIKGLLTCAPYSAEALHQSIKRALESKKSAKNRQLFDQELERRSIANFITNIEAAVTDEILNTVG